MFTCSKTYRDIPLGHRQPFHGGHCSFIHGHNWSIKLSFAAEKPDNNGFIVDFGKLRYIKEWIDDNLDHACAFSAKDPHRNKIEELAELGLIKPLFIDNASCEGWRSIFSKPLIPWSVTIQTAGRGSSPSNWKKIPRTP